MRAIKLNTHVASDRTLRLKLPDDVDEGPAEVIVLVSDATGRRSRTLQDFLMGLSNRRRNLGTKEEIDRYLEQERESWDPETQSFIRRDLGQPGSPRRLPHRGD